MPMFIKLIRSCQILCGKVWLGLGPSRNTPYVPFYGNVQDTYQAFKPQTATYDPNSWYWTVWHIDQMAIKNQDIFGKTVQDHWKMLEKQFIIDQERRILSIIH